MKPTGLFLPLALARDFGGAEITANNNGPEAQSVAVSFIADGERVDAPAWEVAGQTSVTRPLADLMPAGVRLANVDGLVLRFEGRAVDQVVAQVTLLPRQPDGPSQSLDVTPVVPFDFKSTRLNAVWPTPHGDERAVVLLSNVTNNTVTAHVRGPGGPADVTLKPLGHVVLNRPTPQNSAADWLQVDSDGPVGAVAATGYAWSPADRAPVQLRFLDPAIGAQPDLYAGLRAGGAIRLALANTSDSAITATPEFMDADSGVVLIELPAVAIQPHTGVAVNTAAVMQQFSTPRVVGVRVRNTGVKGSLVASLRSVDPLSGLWLDVPLHNAGTDAGTVRRGTGNAPWRIDGDYDTSVIVVNASEDPETYMVRLHYDELDNVSRTHRIVVGATEMYGLRRLRDAGQVGIFPKPLPSDVTHGVAHWSIVGGSAPAYLVGRAEIISASRHVASSFTW